MSYGGEHSFLERHSHEAKGAGIIAGTLLFFALYSAVPPVHNVVDSLIDPAVGGLTLGYGKITSAIFRATGLNFGFVTIPPDQEFLFSVRLATYINNRQAAPLLDLAVDPRVPREKRDRALSALLKFESTADWIQPFLNELAKGGLLYDETGQPIVDTPILDRLIGRVRAEGGIRQTLVRAYAEVVFSFMLQHPDVNMRRHALQWVSDILAEDAVFLIIPRLPRETDPAGQRGIEQALMSVRAVSDPDMARDLLLPYFKSPPWPSVRVPIAAVLARLGDESASHYLALMMQSEELSADQRAGLKLALARTPYPRVMEMAPERAQLAAARDEDRRRQLAMAVQKRQEMLEAARAKQEEASAAAQARRDAEEARARAVEEERVAAQKAEERRVARAKAEADRRARAEAIAKAKDAAERKRLAAAQARQEELERQREARAEAEKQAEEARVRAAKAAEARRQAELAAQEKAERERQASARQAPHEFPVPGGETPETTAKKPATQVARLPEDTLPPPLEDMPKRKPKSLMNYVDIIFEVKSQDVPLYQNPGYDSPTGNVLPVGTKGKANFEVLIGEDKWYQVKSKEGNGWANGSLLSIFNLSPDGVTPAAKSEAAIEGARTESTYFEAAVDKPTYFEKASPKSKKLGTLAADTAYRAIRSEKVGADRWFLLQIRSDETGWVNGVNLQLADVAQPNQLDVPTGPLSQRGKKSAFTPEWVQPGTKGVGVYARPSIAGTMIKQINPGDIYKVTDSQSNDGGEWYRIVLPNKKEGWVQSMDVNLTKPAQ